MWNVTLEFVWTTGFPSFLSRRCVCTWSKLWLSTSYFCRTLLRLRYENATPNFCWVSCAINKRGVWDYIWIDTHLPHFEAFFSFLPPFDALTQWLVCPRFQTVAAVLPSDWAEKHKSFLAPIRSQNDRDSLEWSGKTLYPGLFSPFFSFLRAIFSRPFRLSLAPTGKNL